MTPGMQVYKKLVVSVTQTSRTVLDTMQARSKLDGLSEPLCTIKVPDPDPEIAERTMDLLEDCRYIGSYDWVPDAEEDDPAIVVPGLKSPQEPPCMG